MGNMCIRCRSGGQQVDAPQKKTVPPPIERNYPQKNQKIGMSCIQIEGRVVSRKVENYYSDLNAHPTTHYAVALMSVHSMNIHDRRQKTAQYYRVNNTVWASLQLKHTYTVSLRWDAVECCYAIISALETPVAKTDVP